MGFIMTTFGRRSLHNWVNVEYATGRRSPPTADWMYTSQMRCLVALEGSSFTSELLYPGMHPGSSIAFESIMQDYSGKL